jgi:hypothetical protein
MERVLRTLGGLNSWAADPERAQRAIRSPLIAAR